MKRRLNRLLLLLFLLLAPAAYAQDKPVIEPYDAWFVMKMGGDKAGHMHVTLKQVGDQIISTSQMNLAVKRGNAELKIEQSSRFVETLDFEPISTQNTMKLATMSQQQKLEFKDDKWLLTSTVAGQSSTQQIDPPAEDWLTPGALHKHMQAAIERGEDRISVRTLDLSVGVKPVQIQMKRGETADIEVFGRTVPATLWTMTMDTLPGVAIEQWSDAQGQPVRQVMPLMPGMEIEMLLADKQLATAEFDAPEMLSASLITPDKPIENPRKLKRAVFELVAEDLKKNIGDTVPNAGYQTTEWIDDNTLRITIDLDKPTFPERFEVSDATLSATSMLNFEEEVIQKLIRETIDLGMIQELAKKPTLRFAYEAERNAAKKLRDFVRDHIETKDLSVGFASASETARTKQGDCTEHACLLAAMLRGAGIPSRTVTGLVYADQFAGREGVFGFHMWTQAWLADGGEQHRWVDLDAALPGAVNGLDATHIALSTSAMQDDESFNELVSMLPLMRGLSIEVKQTEYRE